VTQNRVQDALSRLRRCPATGCAGQRRHPACLGRSPYSPDKSRDTLYLSNYAALHEGRARAPTGIGDVQLQGANNAPASGRSGQGRGVQPQLAKFRTARKSTVSADLISHQPRETRRTRSTSRRSVSCIPSNLPTSSQIRQPGARDACW
jgi:hypothetical protein